MAKETTIHIFHHSFRRGGGKERYGLILTSALKSLGHPVVFHATYADEPLAQAMGIELRVIPVSRFPRRLIDYRFARKLDAIRPSLDGLQISLSRVRARDLHISGGNHRGYMARARKFPGSFDLLQIWLEVQCYRFAGKIIAH